MTAPHRIREHGVAKIRFDADNINSAVARLRTSLLRWRRALRVLAAAHTTTVWLGLVAAAVLVGLVLEGSPVPAWKLLVLLGLGLFSAVQRLAKRPLSRRLAQLEEERLLLEAALPVFREPGTLKTIIAPLHLFPRVAALLDADSQAHGAGRYRLALAATGALAMLVFVSLHAFSDERPTHRWLFVEPVEDVAALGFRVNDENAGAWRLEDHAAATGQRALVNHVGGPEAPAATAVSREVHTQDAVLRTRCKAAPDHAQQACGVVFRYASEDDHYVAHIDASTGMVALRVVEAGVERELAATAVSIRSGAWQELEVVAQGERVVVRHNGDARLEAASMPVSGAVGLWASGQSMAYFDELTVEPLPVPGAATST